MGDPLVVAVGPVLEDGVCVWKTWLKIKKGSIGQVGGAGIDPATVNDLSFAPC